MSSTSTFHPRVIELAGLPGAGKTTVAKAVAGADERFLAHVVGAEAEVARDAYDAADHSARSFRSRIRLVQLLPWFLTPITVVRFRSFLLHLFVLIVAHRVRTVFGRNRTENRRVEQLPGLMLILGRLNFVVTRRLQVRMKARRARKSILVEQGYVQEAISIRLRLPHQWRDDLWFRYFRGVPGNCLCVVLEISGDEAIERIGFRDQEQLLIPFSRRAQKSWQTGTAGEDEDWLSDSFGEIALSLRTPQIESRFEFDFVNAARGNDEVLADVLEEVRRLSGHS